MKEQDIDSLFRDAFHEAEEKPSKNVWEQIEKKLDELETPAPLLSNRRYAWLKYAAAAILFLGAGIFLAKIKHSNENQSFDQRETVIAQLPTNILETTTDNKNTPYIETKLENTKHKKNKQNARARLASTSQLSQLNVKSKEKELNNRVQQRLDIADLEETKPGSIDLIQFSHSIATTHPIYQVTEIEDIKPLIDLNDEMESMYAQSPHDNTNKNIVTSLLNSITEKIEVSTTKDIRFRADEEGSFRIDILNSLVKNRNKKK